MPRPAARVVGVNVLSVRAVVVFVVAVAAAAAWSPSVSAQGAALTDAEQLYRETRKSVDRSTQRLGERWYGLVKRQDWTDATGKFTTKARYLEHDQDLKWVKLRAERKVDGQREYKDITVPIERLSKACQSRVGQIAFLESRVAEAAAAVEEEGDDDETAGRHPERMDRGPGSDEPDERGNPDRPAEPATPDSWPTSYDGFRANFTARRQGNGFQVDWGTLVLLQHVHDALFDQDGKAVVPGLLQASMLAAQLAALGEFSWEAGLTKAPADDSEWADRLDLPPLPEPFALKLVLAPDGGDWRRLRVGSRVRITGNFAPFAGQYTIVGAIHVAPSRGQRPPRSASR